MSRPPPPLCAPLSAVVAVGQCGASASLECRFESPPARSRLIACTRMRFNDPDDPTPRVRRRPRRSRRSQNARERRGRGACGQRRKRWKTKQGISGDYGLAQDKNMEIIHPRYHTSSDRVVSPSNPRQTIHSDAATSGAVLRVKDAFPSRCDWCEGLRFVLFLCCLISMLRARLLGCACASSNIFC